MESSEHEKELNLNDICFCTDTFKNVNTLHYKNCDEEYDDQFADKLKVLEEEQEQLNSSLIALTSHFAQVQLRLKQIIESSPDERENLLRSLEEFAFRKIPELKEPDKIYLDLNEDKESYISGSKLEAQRQRQKELIQKLKDQLEELEKYAYETGQSNAIPSGLLLERQTVIIEQLKNKLPLQLDKLDKLSPEELRVQVDNAIKTLVNPVIMKEQLVNQLKTQISDLERFIQFLQIGHCPSRKQKRSSKCTCNCPLHGNSQTSLKKYNEFEACELKSKSNKIRKEVNFEKTKLGLISNLEETNREMIITKFLKPFLTLLHIFAFVQLGCNSNSSNFNKNIKKTFTGNHWGDIRESLEIIVNKIIEINTEKNCNGSESTSKDQEYSVLKMDQKMINIVRKEFCTALRDLIEHGLKEKEKDRIGNSLTQFKFFGLGCFSQKSHKYQSNQGMTAWDLIIKYYHLKNGPELNYSTARKLSQSFNLQIHDKTTVSSKQSLLSTVGDIIESHTKFKRSNDSHFKAFVCEALNQHKLANWVKLIVKNRNIVDNYFESWSYTSSTGFDDALSTLDKLTDIKFKLPTDLAIRQLKNIKEAFN